MRAMNTSGDNTIHGLYSQPSTSSSSRHPSNVGLPETSASESGFAAAPQTFGYPGVDVIAWHSAYQSCQRYFINHAQHSGMVQAVAAFINIRLPFQWLQSPVTSVPALNDGGMAGVNLNFAEAGAGIGAQYPQGASFGRQVVSNPPLPFMSLLPYIRRLIVTGYDHGIVLHGFFGNDWRSGIGSMHEIERRNFMFTAKSMNWVQAKQHYDGTNMDETLPFMLPLQRVFESEITSGNQAWHEWLCMEDWMLGPRAPPPSDVNMENTSNGVPGVGLRRNGGGMGSGGGGAAFASAPLSPYFFAAAPVGSPAAKSQHAGAEYDVAARHEEIMGP
jgi:hypothetical protein